MKKNVISLIGILVVIALTACGNKPKAPEETAQDVQTDTVYDMEQISEEVEEIDSEEIDSEEMDSEEADLNETGSDGRADTTDDVLNHLAGEYEYTAEDGSGRLIIQKTADGYDISDYESESSYRFLANSSNIETIKNNRIYIEYPELLLSDDTVHFSYYILEYGTNGIDVYYGMTEPENAEFLYHAVKKNDKDTDSVTDQAVSATKKIVDLETLDIKEYEYPSEFSMGDNLKTAIAQLSLAYVSFNSDTPGTGGFKETFIAEFIQNSRVSFDYLDLISDQNNGQISIDELNYIQYSLTNTELDFSTLVSGSIDRYEAASPLCSASFTGYEYQDTDNGVHITADVEVAYDGAEDTQKYEVTAELVKNPYSCFDGYSIIALSSTIADNLQGGTGSSANESKADFYEGEYCSYDIDEPVLEIKRNEDGLEFTAAGPGEHDIDGIIKLEGDIATVTIFGQEWLDFAGLSEYKFYKTSDVPNMEAF